jgi:hypothetical protein
MYFHEDKGSSYTVYDENRLIIARGLILVDADEVVAALNFCEEAIRLFPGLKDDETPVSGGDLVELWGERVEVLPNGRYRERRPV